MTDETTTIDAFHYYTGNSKPKNARKQDVTGFGDRESVTPLYDWMLFGVCNVSWAQLQSAAFAELTSGNPIDEAIATVQAFNGSTGKRGIRVRIFVSSDAPGNKGEATWPQSLGGEPVPVTDPTFGNSGVVGHYWTLEFQNAYADLQEKLAAKYDAVPEIRSVTLASSTLLYPEPLRKYSADALIAAGDSLTLEQDAMTAMIAAHGAGRYTQQTYSFNPGDFPGLGGLAYTESQMQAFREALPKLSVLMNNSVRASFAQGSGTMQQMYAAMTSLGKPIALQTAVYDLMGDAATTFGLCVSIGAQSVELPQGYDAIPEALLEEFQAKLISNA